MERAQACSPSSTVYRNRSFWQSHETWRPSVTSIEWTSRADLPTTWSKLWASLRGKQFRPPHPRVDLENHDWLLPSAGISILPSRSPPSVHPTASRRQGSASPLRALDRADPGDALFMRERGGLQAGKSPPGVDDGKPLAAWDHITRYNGGLFYERSGPGPSGKTRKENHDPQEMERRRAGTLGRNRG